MHPAHNPWHSWHVTVFLAAVDTNLHVPSDNAAEALHNPEPLSTERRDHIGCMDNTVFPGGRCVGNSWPLDIWSLGEPTVFHPLHLHMLIISMDFQGVTDCFIGFDLTSGHALGPPAGQRLVPAYLSLCFLGVLHFAYLDLDLFIILLYYLYYYLY